MEQKIYAPEPHCYLQSIGVRPGYQGQGLASGLVRPFLDEADSRGISSYTETMTPSNVGLYEHFGFTCVEQYADEADGFARTGRQALQAAWELAGTESR